MKVKSTLSGSALITLFFILLAPALTGERHWLVLPFENKSIHPEYNWLGEGLALGLSDALSIPGVDVITPEERRAALDLLSFPEGALPSRASAIRLAQTVGADFLLVGNFSISGKKGEEQVTISARLVDVRGGVLAQDPLELKAPLSGIVELQGLLAWNVLLGQHLPLTMSRNQFLSRYEGVGEKAFEAFVKAVMVQDPSTRAEFLQLALKGVASTTPERSYSAAAYHLGKAYFQQQNYAAAIPKLTQLKPGRLYYQESQFYLGLCNYYQGELDIARGIYGQLKDMVPIASVFNNLALIELRQHQFPSAFDHLTFALAADRDDADLWFNYGYALWLNGDVAASAAKLRQALKRQPEDGEAQYLLSKCLNKLGRAKEARRLLVTAEKTLPVVAQWERKGEVPLLARVETEFDRFPLLRMNHYDWQRSVDPLPLQARWPQQLLTAAEQLYSQKEDKEALILVDEVLRKKSDLARAHYLKGKLLERRKQLVGAITEFRAAAFWDPKSVDPLVALGRVYQTLGDSRQALESYQKALSLDPENEKAIRGQRALLGSSGK